MSFQKVSVSEAIDRRMSVRAFLPDPVSLETVREILDVARRSPSGGNLQPWNLDVLAGDPLEEFKALIAQRTAAGIVETQRYAVYPPDLWAPLSTYRDMTGKALYGTIGIARGDEAGRARQFAENFRFFDAPVAIFLSLDRRCGSAQWADLGMFMQTIMLLAIERGLDTCPQECWYRWPDSIAEFLGYDENRLFWACIALGKRDPDAPINGFRSPRAAIDDFTRFHGFQTEA